MKVKFGCDHLIYLEKELIIDYLIRAVEEIFFRFVRIDLIIFKATKKRLIINYRKLINFLMQKKVHLPVSWSEHKKFDLKCTSLDSNKRDSRKIINLCTFLLLTHKTFLINKNSINSVSIYNLWSWHLILSFHLPLLRSCWEFFSSLFLPLKIAPNFLVDYNKIYLRLKARFLVEFSLIYAIFS